MTWQKLKDVYKVAGERLWIEPIWPTIHGYTHTGPIVYVEIQSDKDGRSKGCGVVQFESQADALNAIGTSSCVPLPQM